MHESVSIPLQTQLKLANNEVLKHFVEELNYLKHLESLRDYFFLQDGEFGRNITENLFERLYSANFPLELINCRTLQHLGTYFWKGIFVLKWESEYLFLFSF